MGRKLAPGDGTLHGKVIKDIALEQFGKFLNRETDQSSPTNLGDL